jgi:hypothetical protein
MIKYLLLIIVFPIISCEKKIILTDEYIESSYEIKSGFTISKFQLKKGSKDFRNNIINDSVIGFLFPYKLEKPLKRIYFKQKNLGYHWEYKGNYFDTFPFPINPDFYYRIYSKDFDQKGFSASNISILFKKDFSGKLITYKDTTYMPW